ncbi:sugar O-acetyltransferase, putative [Cordyceps militaris CM01]|uniref:Sugar O-acetyltransferase, putative n=1 Tax=Cordyceps militaris (strain CM01) TaxID=983644 RepID=G3JH40_CORMM|nr:sugar O-acetyltransferase, putative [Cordyceps militaris CM01]EGX91596.1 sugar O-acetyltransferase, putative [Cordyceps militaris CM01]
MAATDKDAAAIELAKTLEHIPWCDDYEKMISGVLYDAQVPELVQGRFRARRLMHKYDHNHGNKTLANASRYNTTFPDDATLESLEKDRTQALVEIFGKVGKGAYIEPPLSVDYGCNIVVGDNFYSNFNLVILDCALVQIGNRVMFGPFVSIFSATHETGVQSRRDGVEYAKPVVIGDDCWIGGNTTIMPGVTIGKGCTIGAGSIVTKSIPDFSVAIGTPARVVKTVDAVPDL